MKRLIADDKPTSCDTTREASPFQGRDWDTFAVDGLRIHFPSQTVHVDGRLIKLTQTEYRLLRHLVRNAGRVLTHRALLQHAWSSDCSTTDVVRFQISRLRAKLEPGCVRPRFIFKEPGVGYWFRGPADGPLGEQLDTDDRPIVRLPNFGLAASASSWETVAA